MRIQERIFKFVTLTNWALLVIIGSVGLIFTSSDFAMGILCGGLIASINFHLLSRTLKKSFLGSVHVSFAGVLAKYYIRFGISAIIIFMLVTKNVIHPVGLVIGLSVVVISVTLAGVIEAKKIICEETV